MPGSGCPSPRHLHGNPPFASLLDFLDVSWQRRFLDVLRLRRYNSLAGDSVTMLSFLLGWAAGSVLVFNGDKVRRALARSIVLAEDVGAAATQYAVRTAGRLAEDLEDIVAEARASRAESH